MEKFTEFFHGTVLGLGNNNGITLKENTEYTFKSYYKLRLDGKNTFKLFFINEVESTGNFKIGKKGDSYFIESAYAAFSHDKETEESKTCITFNGCESKKTERGESFSTDEFSVDYKKDGFLVLSFTVRTMGRTFIPGTTESASTGRVFENGREIFYDNLTLRPQFVGVKKEFAKTVAFMGDSITQGTRTAVDAYEAWTHRIGESLPENISFWNIGMGWARAYDGAQNGVLCEKGAMCDEIFICFGVNDIRAGGRTGEEVIADMEKIKDNLLKRNGSIKVHFLTVPPFNMSEFEEQQRQKINSFVKSTEEYFDIAIYLECDNKGTVNEKYMTSAEDSHPNGLGGKAVFDGFVEWQEKRKWQRK